ncbi:MAG: hypothetical protein AAF802_10285 [Planctomycetota bacterium]
MNPTRWRFDSLIHSAAVLWALMICGCASRSSQIVEQDRSLVRSVDAGKVAFNEGDLQEAEKSYRKALMRAWAIDDPYESGTLAYNLAACLTAQSRENEAIDWLADAQVDLCRANSSTANLWLLSAQIAISQERFDEASRCVELASRTCPPCELDGSNCLCGPSSRCQAEDCDEDRLLERTCIGEKHRMHEAQDECEQAFAARVELTRARLAISQFDIESGCSHLQCSRELSSELCNLSLSAEQYDVSALIRDARQQYVCAGADRDREIKLLRCIGQYREIPDILDDAAVSYQSGERFDLAVDRLVRSARIRFSRGQLQSAWERVNEASDLVELCDSAAAETRLRLTAQWIRDALEEEVPQSAGDSAAGSMLMRENE